MELAFQESFYIDASAKDAPGRWICDLQETDGSAKNNQLFSRSSVCFLLWGNQDRDPQLNPVCSLLSFLFFSGTERCDAFCLVNRPIKFKFSRRRIFFDDVEQR